MITDGKMNVLLFSIAIFAGMGYVAYNALGAAGVTVMCTTIISVQALQAARSES